MKFKIGYGDDTTVHLYDTYRLVAIKDSLAAVPSPCTKWQFKSRHSAAIDWDEIKKDVTRKRPLAIVMVGDAAYTIVHKSLVKKAAVIQKGEGWKDPKHTTVQVCGSSKNLSSVVDYWKVIKKAPWPNAKTRTVSVSLVNMS